MTSSMKRFVSSRVTTFFGWEGLRIEINTSEGNKWCSRNIENFWERKFWEHRGGRFGIEILLRGAIESSKCKIWCAIGIKNARIESKSDSLSLNLQSWIQSIWEYFITDLPPSRYQPPSSTRVLTRSSGLRAFHPFPGMSALMSARKSISLILPVWRLHESVREFQAYIDSENVNKGWTKNNIMKKDTNYEVKQLFSRTRVSY